MPLNTNIQAVAARVTLRCTLTVCSVYSSQNYALTKDGLNKLLQQLPASVLLLGVFNAYSEAWGCRREGPRGKMLLEFTVENNLNILNDGSPTRIADNAESAIDLSIATSHLETDI